ncbi:hypothetical protein V5799_026734 [Amblyomma americanum]|uniref:Uncharacterized protein n=1 Tax=Amblyomma americanum TaxID=6943 RepID=A0AAQ4DHR2_AMBAM
MGPFAPSEDSSQVAALRASIESLRSADPLVHEQAQVWEQNLSSSTAAARAEIGRKKLTARPGMLNVPHPLPSGRFLPDVAHYGRRFRRPQTKKMAWLS